MHSILFCSDVMKCNIPHPMWEDEARAASKVTNIHLLDEEKFGSNITKSLRRLPYTLDNKQPIIYRGWMRLLPQYTEMFFNLKEKGYDLVNNPDSYIECHHIGNWYSKIIGLTPETMIIDYPSEEQMVDHISSVSYKSVVIKDFVCSMKHSWNDACYIPDTKDLANVKRVVKNFIGLQDNIDSIQGGLAIREYVKLKSIGFHPKSKMPLSQEFRTFVLNGRVVNTSKYWEYGTYNDSTPPDSLIQSVIKRIKSRFFTIDTAQKEDGSYTVIEVGDGQVSSLPDLADVNEFYTSLLQQ